MGYDVHITRKENWSDKDGPAITLREWSAFVRDDAEMRLDGYAETVVGDGQVLRTDSDGLSVWTAYSHHEKDGNAAWFVFHDGNIVVKNPDPEILRKMWAIAQRLSAKVQGDEGEIYDSEGSPLSEPTGLSSALLNKPWWKFW